MINLLPIGNKRLVKREFLRRFIVVFGLSLSILLFAQIILSSSLFFLANSFAGGFNQQVVFVERIAKLKNLEDFEAKAGQLNSLLGLFHEEEKASLPISGDVFKILKLVPLSIKIDSLLFDSRTCNDCAPSISVGGYAATRSDLRNFISALTLSGYFRNIKSPVSNLLDERDVGFSLVVELKNEER